MRIVTPSQMREIDRRAIRELGIPSLRLMEKAGGAVAEAALALLGEGKGAIALVCGPGNNGGDGMAAARLLFSRRRKPVIYLAAPASSLSGDAGQMLARARRAGVPAVDISTPSRLARALHRLMGADLVVDALFGTGMDREVSGHYAEVVRAVNGCPAPVLAVDTPSGIHGETGKVLGEAVMADATVTLTFPKLGLLLPPGTEFAGELAVADIGIPEEAAESLEAAGELAGPEWVAAAFPRRPIGAHKGDFGHLLVVAGSPGKAGAGILAAEGAFRCGVGLVTLALPESVLHLPQAVLPEVMTSPLPETKDGALSAAGATAVRKLLEGRDALAIGPGLGIQEETRELVRRVLSQTDVPAVVDADALNALGRDLSPLRGRGGRTVLTPHPGEAARLLGTDPAEVQADRISSARRLAESSGCTVVLKGSRTVVAAPEGRWFLNPTGNPGMATAGMGDVLTGMVGSLLARGLPPLTASLASVWLHGAAGDLAAEEVSEEAMTARDLASRIGPTLMDAMEGRRRC